jgi:hypothetical protein
MKSDAQKRWMKTPLGHHGKGGQLRHARAAGQERYVVTWWLLDFLQDARTANSMESRVN